MNLPTSVFSSSLHQSNQLKKCIHCLRPGVIISMNPSPTIAPRADLRDYLAAERTFLAWIRTGLALMGFGFVVARFGLFLQQLQFIQKMPQARSSGLSLWFGTTLIASGVVVNLIAGWHHLRLVRQLDRGEKTHSHSTLPAVAITLFLALVGLGMTVYLIAVGSNNHSESGNAKELTMSTLSRDTGIMDVSSRHSVDETVDKLKAILVSKGVTLFAVVDHSGEAERVGMKMRPTKLLIFGSPKAGTPLMLASPTSAIDLPLKMLVWEDPKGNVLISYNSPEYLAQRHGIPLDLLQNIAVVKALADLAAE